MLDNQTCVLCLAGIPGGRYDASGGLHHIVPRSRIIPTELLEDELNKAVSCLPHHEAFGHAPHEPLWWEAKIKLGMCYPEDFTKYHKYVSRPRLYFPEFGDCIGSFGEGDDYLGEIGGIPESYQKVFCGVTGNQLSSFCKHMCTYAPKCLQKTRESLIREIRGIDK